MLIKQMLKDGKTYKFIQKTLGCSPTVIANAKKWKKSEETRGRKRKTTKVEDRNIILAVKRDPFKSSSEIKRDLNLQIDSSTIRRRLIEANLRARRPRKVLLLNAKQIQQRLRFAKEHTLWNISKWKNILWSDESKIVRFDSGAEKKHVRRPQRSAFNPRFTTKTVKHGGFSVMVWGCFSWYGVGPLVWIKDTMNSDVYLKIMRERMLPYAEDNMPLKWVYMQDNDPKHTSKKAKKWFKDNNINLMVWPSQSPDLNPIENFWSYVKKELVDTKAKNKKELWNHIKLIWGNISIERCRGLIKSMKMRCKAVIRNKGNATRY